MVTCTGTAEKRSKSVDPKTAADIQPHLDFRKLPLAHRGEHLRISIIAKCICVHQRLCTPIMGTRSKSLMRRQISWLKAAALLYLGIPQVLLASAVCTARMLFVQSSIDSCSYSSSMLMQWHAELRLHVTVYVRDHTSQLLGAHHMLPQ